MKNKSKLNKWTAFDTIITIVAVLVCTVTLYPMLYVVSCSISDPLQVLAGNVVLLPKGFSLDAYKLVVIDPAFWRSFANSIFYVVASCVLMFFTTVAIAYPLTRPNLKFRQLLTYFLLIPMFFGGGMIPAFIVVTKLGLYNSVWSLILPTCYSIWNIILCRTFMASLSNELVESATIDGCNQFQTLLKIVLPLSKPVIAVIMIYTIVGVWNSWFNASIYTTNADIQPVQLYMKNALSATTTTASAMLDKLPVEMQQKYRDMAMAGNQIKYAMIVITTLPIIFVYPMFQKHFTKGMMLGSLKG